MRKCSQPPKHWAWRGFSKAHAKPMIKESRNIHAPFAPKSCWVTHTACWPHQRLSRLCRLRTTAEMASQHTNSNRPSVASSSVRSKLIVTGEGCPRSSTAADHVQSLILQTARISDLAPLTFDLKARLNRGFRCIRLGTRSFPFLGPAGPL